MNLAECKLYLSNSVKIYKENSDLSGQLLESQNQLLPLLKRMPVPWDCRTAWD